MTSKENLHYQQIPGRGYCRNIRYRFDEKEKIWHCEDKDCGMFSRNEMELLKFHFFKIEQGVLVNLPLPAEKFK